MMAPSAFHEITVIRERARVPRFADGSPSGGAGFDVTVILKPYKVVTSAAARHNSHSFTAINIKALTQSSRTPPYHLSQIKMAKRTVLITGCLAGGIGAALAKVYLDRGYHVLASARNTSKIPTSLATSPDVTSVTLDVCSAESIKSAVRQISEATGGQLDVLINNAGSSLSCPTLDTSLDDARTQMELHFIAPLAVTQAFFPLLLNGTHPVIVNNSSIAGETNLPFQGIYGASKSATSTFSETLRLEVDPLGVRVVTCITGIIETNLHSNEKPQPLPQSSYYRQLHQWLQERKDGTNRPPGMNVDAYAKEFVQKVEGGARGKIYVGPLSNLFVYLQWWCPQFIWVRRRGLNFRSHVADCL